MNSRLLEKWQIIKQVIEGSKTLKHASRELAVSYRQAIRIKDSVTKHGIRGLIHGNTGRKPVNTLNPEVQALILRLSKDSYAGLCDTLFSEHLFKQHNISVSRETVRKIRRAAGIKPVQIKRSSRTKELIAKPKEGRRIMWYALNNRWFGDQFYPCCLLAAIDEATYRCIAARFFPYEEISCYLLLLKEIISNWGIPHSIIQESNDILKRSSNDWSIEEELQGYQTPTQVERALHELNIEIIYTTNKRQKSKLTQLFSQFHNEITSEILKKNVSDIREVNIFLNNFMSEFNKNYAVQETRVIKVWKSPPSAKEVDRICSYYYETNVKPNNTVVIGRVKIKLPAKWESLAYSGVKIEVRQLLDGTWKVYYQKQPIAELTESSKIEIKKTKVNSLQPDIRIHEARV